MTFLIAEISNHHFGSLEKAKELIRIAKESGANAVKGQAFVAEDMVKFGSMPLDFYKKCALKYKEYKELLLYGDSINIPVFFTILSSKLSLLASLQKYKKLHAKNAETCRIEKFWHYDHKDIFISLRAPRLEVKRIRRAHLLYATEYLKDVDFLEYQTLKKFYERIIGVSHHGKTCENLYELRKNNLVPWVEKHFYLGDEIKWDGQIYRDCLHSFTPKEFEDMRKRLS